MQQTLLPANHKQNQRSIDEDDGCIDERAVRSQSSFPLIVLSSAEQGRTRESRSKLFFSSSCLVPTFLSSPFSSSLVD